MIKVEVGGCMYTYHPELGWLLLGSWGWQPIHGPH